MFIAAVTPGPKTGNTDQYLVSGPMIAYIASHPTSDNLVAAGAKVAAVDATTFNNMIAAAAALKGALSGSLGVSGTLNVS